VLATTVSGPVVDGETIKVKNYDGKGGVGVWYVGAKLQSGSHSANFQLQRKKSTNKLKIS
jgi:hypothetical protein